MNLNLIQAKLVNYGITFDDYKNQTGNFVGNMNVPTALLSYNSTLTVEEAFYLVANKVFEAANILAYGVPLKASINFKKVVGHEAFRDFKSAIYEEINQRWLSNAFVEFSNSGSTSFANINQTQPVAGGMSLFEWINPLSQQKIRNIDWLSFDLLKQGDDIFLFTNMENLNIHPSTKTRVIGAGQNGSLVLFDKDELATSEGIEQTNKTLEETIDELTKQIERINVNTETLEHKADISFVVDAVKALPLSENWVSDKSYNIPQIVYYNGKLYWNVRDNNLGHVPGGATGLGWWEELTNIIPADRSYELAYKAGTNTVKSFINPNDTFYFEIKELIDQQIDSVDKLKQFGINKFPLLNLNDNDFQEFSDNFFNLDLAKIKEVFYDVGDVKIKNKLFNKEQISLFGGKQLFNDWLNKYNLDNPNNQITDTDYIRLYETYSDGVLRLSGNDNITTGGNYYIHEGETPYKEFSFSLKNIWYDRQPEQPGGDYSNLSLACVRGQNITGSLDIRRFVGKWNNVTLNSMYQRPSGYVSNESYGIQGKLPNPVPSGQDVYYGYTGFTFFVGKQYQEKHIPQHMTLYGVKWNKDIEVETNLSVGQTSSELKWFVNISDINLVVNNQANLDLKHRVEALEKGLKDGFDKLDLEKASKTDLDNYLTKTASDAIVAGLNQSILLKSDKIYVENEIIKVNDNITFTNQKLNDVNTKLYTQINRIDSNETNINLLQTKTTNTDNRLDLTNQTLSKVIDDLQNANFSNYQGPWNSTHNYVVGDIVNKNNNFYICLIPNTQKDPDNSPNEWDLLNFTIDVSDYVTKQELKIVNDKVDVNVNNINEVKNELITIKDDIVVNRADIDTNQQHLDQNDQKITTLETNQANLINKTQYIEYKPGLSAYTFTKDLDFQSNKTIKGLPNPTADQQAVNKRYADQLPKRSDDFLRFGGYGNTKSWNGNIATSNLSFNDWISNNRRGEYILIFKAGGKELTFNFNLFDGLQVHYNKVVAHFAVPKDFDTVIWSNGNVINSTEITNFWLIANGTEFRIKFQNPKSMNVTIELWRKEYNQF